MRGLDPRPDCALFRLEAGAGSARPLNAMRLLSRIVPHLQVFWRAAVFGLGAYVVIRVLIYLSDKAGLLDWLHRPPS